MKDKADTIKIFSEACEKCGARIEYQEVKITMIPYKIYCPHCGKETSLNNINTKEGNISDIKK